jgi:hypothetical protein
VCNCHAPAGPSVSSRRQALEQAAAQRQQAAWEQQAAAAEQQRLAAPAPPPAAAAASSAPLTPAPEVQPAFQAAPQQVPVWADAEPAPPSRSPDGGSSAKKRVRRTDWEGRKCDWCGVTETSNWRRHPDNRDMLLCNQCGGYVRKHGKLSQERRDRVAAQQVAVAMATAAAPPPGAAPLHAANGLGGAGAAGAAFSLPNGTMPPLFQAAPVTMPPLGTLPPMPPPELHAEGMEVDEKEEGEGAAQHEAPPIENAAASECLPGGAAELAGLAPVAAQAQVQQQQRQQQAGMEAEDDAAVAALLAAAFAPWQAQLTALREQRQAAAAVAAAACAPFQAQQPAPIEVKLEPQAGGPAAPPPAAMAPKLEQLPAMAACLEAAAPAAQRRISAAAAAAAAAPTLTRTGSGSLRRAAAAGAAAAAQPQVGCGDSCLNRLSFIHCDRSTCPCGERCTNRPFVELASPAMEVFLTPDKGWGVRASAFIPRGSFVVEYAGEVIDDRECSRRAEEAKARNEPHFYMMEMAPGGWGGGQPGAAPHRWRHWQGRAAWRAIPCGHNSITTQLPSTAAALPYHHPLCRFAAAQASSSTRAARATWRACSTAAATQTARRRSGTTRATARWGGQPGWASPRALHPHAQGPCLPLRLGVAWLLHTR